jgi:hypothetical protein
MSLYDIEKIKIMIKTNIPDKEPLPFDSKMLYTSNKVGYSDYPYITKQVRYPYDELAKMSYSDITDFFFVKKVFVNILSKSIKQQKVNPLETLDQKKLREEANMEHNIITMLELLFPTYYPTYNNFFISFVSNIGGKMEIPHKSVFGNKNKQFSYINIDKPYTISKITWLNDIINHPVYGEFIDDFYNYKKWAEYIIPEIENKIKTSQSDINRLIQNMDVNNEIRELEKYFTNLDNNRRGYQDSNISQSKFNISNMIKILRVIDIYKQFLKNDNKDGFLSVYAKIINDLIDPAKNNWVEYNANSDKYWYPVQILKYNNSDDTYDIYIYKYKDGDYIAEVEKYVSSSRLRPFNIKPETNTVNYEFANYSDTRQTSKKNLNNIFTSSRASVEQISSINSVNTDYGTADIKIGSTEYKNIHFIYLRSLSESSVDSTKYTKEPQQYLSDSLYKLKEIHSNLRYTNFSLNFKNFIQKLLEINDKKIQYSTFKYSYLNTENDYLKFDIKFQVDDEFEQFTELSKNIQKISSSYTKTTNNTLQVIIDDYVNNSKKYEIEFEDNGVKYKSHLFYELLNYINNCYLLNSNCSKNDIYNVYAAIKEKENILNFEKFAQTNDNTLLKTNINRINLKGGKNLPHYEIYIAMDLLGDKIDETNINKIKCAYQDYNATNNLTNVKQNPYIVENGPLIELPKNPQNDLDKKPPIGGRTKRKRNKNKKRPRKITQRNSKCE